MRLPTPDMPRKAHWYLNILLQRCMLQDTRYKERKELGNRGPKNTNEGSRRWRPPHRPMDRRRCDVNVVALYRGAFGQVMRILNTASLWRDRHQGEWDVLMSIVLIEQHNFRYVGSRSSATDRDRRIESRESPFSQLLLPVSFAFAWQFSESVGVVDVGLVVGWYRSQLLIVAQHYLPTSLACGIKSNLSRVNNFMEASQ